jgi:hypothetical protein
MDRNGAEWVQDDEDDGHDASMCISFTIKDFERIEASFVERTSSVQFLAKDHFWCYSFLVSDRAMGNFSPSTRRHTKDQNQQRKRKFKRIEPHVVRIILQNDTKKIRSYEIRTMQAAPRTPLTWECVRRLYVCGVFLVIPRALIADS